MIEITTGPDSILIKYEGDPEPIEAPVDKLIEVIAEKFPMKLLRTKIFLKECPK